MMSKMLTLTFFYNFELESEMLEADVNPQAPDRFTPHVPVAQKIADQRWLIANSAKNMILTLNPLKNEIWKGLNR